ncbi:hypothetical protein [Reticulibacter mediterranei]|uniref:hypothetical protein n=1 Tax=Reticulibacter mediterranei TaxID=2778369 RepID=UPI001C68E7DD|nr:hypothetical protein [Reticulibacter mediterranei]
MLPAVDCLSPDGQFWAIAGRHNTVDIYRRTNERLPLPSLREGHTTEEGWEKWLTSYLHRDGVYNRPGHVCKLAWLGNRTICTESNAGSIYIWHALDGVHLATKQIARDARP